MNFFLDENTPKAVMKILESMGHTVYDIRSTSQEGADDITIFKLAQEKQAVFITTDKDFFHTIPYQFHKHYGIIVITLRQPHRHNIIDKILLALKIIDLAKMDSKVILLKDNTYTII